MGAALAIQRRVVESSEPTPPVLPRGAATVGPRDPNGAAARIARLEGDLARFRALSARALYALGVFAVSSPIFLALGVMALAWWGTGVASAAFGSGAAALACAGAAFFRFRRHS